MNFDFILAFFTLDNNSTGDINPQGVAVTTTTQQLEEEAVPTSEGTQSDTPLLEYVMTKEIIHQLVDELFKARRKRKKPMKGKEKCNLILQEPSDDDKEDLYTSATQILEDASKK